MSPRALRLVPEAPLKPVPDSEGRDIAHAVHAVSARLDRAYSGSFATDDGRKAAQALGAELVELGKRLMGGGR